jgi:hypothetical protein
MSWRSGAGTLSVVAVTLSLALTCGCTAGDEPSGVSAPNLSPTPIKQIDKEKAAAVAVVQAFNVFYRRSLQGDDQLDTPRLRELVTQPYLSQVRRQIRQAQRRDVVMRGRDRYTPRSVRVDGSRARVVTCWDPTGANLMVLETTPPRRIAAAQPNLTTFVMEKSRGRWRISRRIPDGSC